MNNGQVLVEVIRVWKEHELPRDCDDAERASFGTCGRYQECETIDASSAQELCHVWSW